MDPNSKVSKLKASNRDYGLLGGLFLKPRTTYLAMIYNPNPELAYLTEEDDKKDDDHEH